MTKLIEKFRNEPTAANRAKLQAHLNKNMMAVCMATAEELAFLKSNGFSV